MNFLKEDAKFKMNLVWSIFTNIKNRFISAMKKQQATKIAKISFVYGEIGFLKHMQPSLFYVAGFDAVRYPYG